MKNPLDREVANQHNLTVMVRGKGTNSNRNYTRVTINVLDHNDHQPKFLSDVFFGRVFETAAIGTSVVQVLAVDADRGQNAEISYSIQTGGFETKDLEFLDRYVRANSADLEKTV